MALGAAEDTAGDVQTTDASGPTPSHGFTLPAAEIAGVRISAAGKYDTVAESRDGDKKSCTIFPDVMV